MMPIARTLSSLVHAAPGPLGLLYLAHRFMGTQVPGQDRFEGRYGRPFAPYEPPTLTWGMAYHDLRVFEPMRWRAHPEGPDAPWYIRHVGHLAQSMADMLLMPFIGLAVGYALVTGGTAGARQVLEHQGLGVCLTRGVALGLAAGAMAR